MKLLDRYVLRSFLEPFFLCFCSFIAIWLIIDLSDNGTDFLEAKASPKLVAGYYLTQLPKTIVETLPIGLLLALLFSLSRMSRTNEIISMLTAGRSVSRVLVPLLLIGLALSGVALWLNWEAAPKAENIKNIALNQIRRGKKAGELEPVAAHLFRDRQHHRTWYVKRLRPGAARLDGVHITQQDAEGRITRKWYAERALYDLREKTWTLEKGMMVEFTPEGDIASTDYFPANSRTIKDWAETPWRVASSELNPQGLSVPELRDYLEFNADFPSVQLAPYRAHLADRWAYSLHPFIAVVLAGTLGIIFNRRGAVGAIALAIGLYLALFLGRLLFLAVAKGGRIDPQLAVWLPDLALGVLGLVLLWFRSTNRDLPTLWKRR